MLGPTTGIEGNQYDVVRKWGGFELRQGENRLLMAGSVHDLFGSSVAICSGKPVGYFNETHLRSVRLHESSRRLTFAGHMGEKGGEPQFFGMYCDKRTHDLRVVITADSNEWRPERKEDDMSNYAKREARDEKWEMLKSYGRRCNFSDAAASDHNVMLLNQSKEAVWSLRKIGKDVFRIVAVNGLPPLTCFGLAIAVLKVSGL
jgi:hypothetical protein